MSKLGLLVRLEAKTGKESDVETFIKDALQLAIKEDNTLTWYSFRINENTFGIYDTFPNEEARAAHLKGKIAQQLMANASELLASEPIIERLDVLAAK